MKYSYRGYETDPENGIVFGKRGAPITKTSNGYIYIYPKSGDKKLILCHRAIWISVNGEIAEGLQINHINGIKSDNRISNLELTTPTENCLHAYKLGFSSANGEMNGRAILNKTKVLEIKNLFGKYTGVQISRMYGVKQTTISQIRTGKIWNSDLDLTEAA